MYNLKSNVQDKNHIPSRKKHVTKIHTSIHIFLLCRYKPSLEKEKHSKINKIKNYSTGCFLKISNSTGKKVFNLYQIQIVVAAIKATPRDINVVPRKLIKRMAPELSGVASFSSSSVDGFSFSALGAFAIARAGAGAIDLGLTKANGRSTLST